MTSPNLLKFQSVLAAPEGMDGTQTAPEAGRVFGGFLNIDRGVEYVRDDLQNPLVSRGSTRDEDASVTPCKQKCLVIQYINNVHGSTV